MSRNANVPRYLGIVPARGGSKRLPGKNLLPLGGKPLLGHTLEAARAARRLSAVVVSTDSQQIADYRMDELESADIDTEYDLQWVESILARRPPGRQQQ